MNGATVTEAIRTLRAQGERISVRAVHQLTGGSFRDLSRILRESRDVLADEEVAGLEVEPETPPPAPGRLAEIAAAIRELDRRTADIQPPLEDALAQLAQTAS
jgi:Plasmid replication region DNA-binding N-term